MQFSHEDFKKCLGNFASSVTIVTMLDASFELQGVTISSFSSLSLEPAMIAFNLGKESYLHSKILNCDAFAVNILASNQVDLAHKFAKRKEDKWLDVKHTNGLYGSPLLNDAAAFIECLTWKIYDGGDHSIITGRVVNLQTNENAKPAVYYKGNYYSLGEKIV